MFNKFYKDGIYGDVEIKLKFGLKLHNITRFEGGEYGLTFLFYLHEHFTRRGGGQEVINIFFSCAKPDGTLLIPDALFLKRQQYYFNVKIEDNPNNPMTGTEENPLQYEVVLTLKDFPEPSPAVEKCLKKGCVYTNYFGICRNHEDELTAKELEDVKNLQAMHEKILEEFESRIDASEGVYNLVGTHKLPEDEYSDDPVPVMIITPSTI